MKKFLLLMLLPLTVMGQGPRLAETGARDFASAQSTESFYYVFQQSSATYQDLTTPTWTYNFPWDDPEDVAIDFPFSTSYLGVTIDSLFMDYGGYLLATSASSEEEMLIAAMGADLVDRSYGMGTAVNQSPLSYEITGSAPNRIFKFEWKNTGFYDEFDNSGTNNDYANMQLWIYEDERVEFRFGPNSVSQATLNTIRSYEELISALAVFDFSTMDINNAHFLQGNPAAPTLVDTISQLNGWPANGTVYSFSLSGIGMDEQQGVLEVDLYPNPATTELRVRCEEGQEYAVALMDLSGRIVKRGTLSASQAVNISDIPRGVYLSRITDKATGQMTVVRLVVK